MTASRRAMAQAVRRNDWDRIAVCLLLGISIAARKAPPGTIDDLLALLAAEDAAEAKEVRHRDAGC